MKCPNDGAVLTMSERSGVEIDYCPECRGVWLDRGELDKILDRVAAETPAAPRRRAGPSSRTTGSRDTRTAPGYSSGSYARAASTRATASRRRRSTGSPSSSTRSCWSLRSAGARWRRGRPLRRWRG